jgi:hypothetical protein
MAIGRSAAAVAAVMLGLGLAVGSAHADVVYTLTLTDQSDPTYSGTGTITLSSAPNPTGQSDYSSAAVSFEIDGVNFSGTAAHVRFTDGSFVSAQFSQEVGMNPNRFDLQTNSSYQFSYDNEQVNAFGTIASALAPTPLPAALPLFAGGLGALGFIGWRKKRRAAA